MAKLEDLTRGVTIPGILPDCLTVVDLKWHGSAAVGLTYEDLAGKPNIGLLYRDREPQLWPARSRVICGEGLRHGLDCARPPLPAIHVMWAQRLGGGGGRSHQPGNFTGPPIQPKPFQSS